VFFEQIPQAGAQIVYLALPEGLSLPQLHDASAQVNDGVAQSLALAALGLQLALQLLLLLAQLGIGLQVGFSGSKQLLKAGLDKSPALLP
jgi:hypothetical protein